MIEGLHVSMSLREQIAEFDRQIAALGIQYENPIRDSRSTYENPIRWLGKDEVNDN